MARAIDAAATPCRRARRRAATRVALGLLVAAPGCQERVNRVRLTLRQIDAGPGSLLCRTADAATPQSLASRARLAPPSVVIDFLEVPAGFPCERPNAAVLCARACCRLRLDLRVCAPLPPVPPDLSNRATAAAIERSLAGLLVTSAAPPIHAMVRMVVTTQDCRELEPAPGSATAPAFDRSRLVGCARSCTLDLRTAAGTQELALYPPADTLECEPNVAECSEVMPEPSAACAAGSGP